jgi:diguanylate cyclase (GGDEF)-like protein
MTANDKKLKTQRINSQTVELGALMEIGKALTSSLNLREVLQVIMGKISELLQPKSWSLLMVDPETSELYFEIAVSPVAEQLKQLRLKPGEGIAGWVAEHGEPLLITDAQTDARFAKEVDCKVDFTTRSVICVPLNVRGRVLGVIELINRLEDTLYQENDLTILSTIADFAAIAIENARNYERMCELVVTDDLTGLYNARHFSTIIDREFQLAKRYTQPLSLLFLDLDHFKKVNDSYGHLTGSRVIGEVGKLIKRNIRSVDYAARYGGDEYVVLLPNTNRQGALTVANHLRDFIRQHPFVSDDGTAFGVTASFGMASYPEDAATRDDLLRFADQAMYMVKETTRDGIR